MSFHKDMFHETKRERKYYEDKKQKALRYLDHTIEDFRKEYWGTNVKGLTDEEFRKFGLILNKLKELKKRVNDI